MVRYWVYRKLEQEGCKMKIHYEIEQGSEIWHRERYGKISGTNSKGLFVDSDTLLNNLIACKLEAFKLEPPGYENDAMIRGNELEPFARMELSRKIGIKLVQAGWIQSLGIPIIGISPDGISECETIMCEFKCPSKEVHTATLLSNEIPLKNIHQCLHYFTVNKKLKELHFGSFRPESKIRLFHKIVTLDSLINMGTEKKPVLFPISELVRKARGEAQRIEIKVDQIIKELIKP